MARKGFDMQTAAIIGIILAVVAGVAFLVVENVLIGGLSDQQDEALTQLQDAEDAAKEAGEASSGTPGGFTGSGEFGCENA